MKFFFNFFCLSFLRLRRVEEKMSVDQTVFSPGDVICEVMTDFLILKQWQKVPLGLLAWVSDVDVIYIAVTGSSLWQNLTLLNFWKTESAS